MSIKHLTYLLFLIICTSCIVDDPEPEPIIPNASCSSNLYTYYKNEKLDLSKRLLNNYIIIGFNSSNPHNSIESDLFSGTSTRLGSVDMYQLKKTLSCSDLNNLRLTLKQQNNVSFVSMAYARSSKNLLSVNVDLDFNNENYIYSTDNFIVELNKTEDIELLNQMLTKTKTVLVKEIKINQYLIKTNRESKGDALEMANYFQETKQFKMSIPDWLGLDKHIEEYEYFY